MSSFSGVLDAPTHTADGSPSAVTLTAGAEMGIWTEQGNFGQCSVTDPTGQAVALNANSAVSVNTGNFSLGGIFTPTVDGSYEVQCTSSGTPFEFRVAPSVQVAKFAGGLVIGIGLIIVTGLAGLAILIVGIVRRVSWNSQYGRRGVPGYPPVGGYPPAGSYPPAGPAGPVPGRAN
ncbi:MAG: hypothetical protein LBI33_00435 [Propionibacteriaceae bacterium]|nr:hypothetical protein [Propionibacteriaceae bacterium]